MDFESPDVEKDFPGLYASESTKRSLSRDSDFSDEEKTSRKDLLGKKREKRESKRDKGYVAFEGESSEDEIDETRSPGRNKKSKSSTFKFPGKDKKEKHSKTKDREAKEKKEEKEKIGKRETKELKKDDKTKIKKKKERTLLKIKDRKKKNTDQEKSEEKPIFGVPLQVAVERSKSHDGIELPVVVRECIDYIEEHGLACEGIYRISGLKSKIGQLKAQYNKGEKVYLYEHEPHVVANLLKQFLRDLPEPVLTFELKPKFEEAAALKNERKKVETLEKLLNELPNCNRLLLSWIFVHMLHVISLEKRNKMNLQNISIVLGPAMQISHHVLQAFFAHSNVLFKGVEIKKYVPPIELDSSRLSLELPDSPLALAEELLKQENVLSILHAELNAGLRDKQKEEQLWEVQRVVTQLKRKLRFVRQVQDASNPRSEDSEIKNKSTNDMAVNMAIQQVSNTELPAKCEEKSEVNLNIGNSVVKDIVAPSKDPENKVSEMVNVVVETENTAQVSPTSTEKESVAESSVVINKDEGPSKSEEKSVSREVHVVDTFEKSTSQLQERCADNFTQCKNESVPVLHREGRRLQLKCDELMLLCDELKQKLNSETLEIERLKMEVSEYQQLYKFKRYSFDSTENSSSDRGDSSASDADDEEEDLAAVLEDLMKDNKQLEVNISEGANLMSIYPRFILGRANWELFSSLAEFTKEMIKDVPIDDAVIAVTNITMQAAIACIPMTSENLQKY
ncbi:ralA-binding protein 1-like [Stegodyphus dumicola]|uniref:ralA-binding protein 1-like n=1 Tax=Stegodyphus dumicola TaxID=202533 RepID=UPI0015B21227|nr:ralA-binding protein 1-like [Stegodyphus dumicola]